MTALRIGHDFADRGPWPIRGPCANTQLPGPPLDTESRTLHARRPTDSRAPGRPEYSTAASIRLLMSRAPGRGAHQDREL